MLWTAVSAGKQAILPVLQFIQRNLATHGQYYFNLDVKNTFIPTMLLGLTPLGSNKEEAFKENQKPNY